MHALTLGLTTAIALSSVTALPLGGCSTDAQKESDTAAIVQGAMTPLAAPNPERNAYFGAVRVHTGWSFDVSTPGSPVLVGLADAGGNSDRRSGVRRVAAT